MKIGQKIVVFMETLAWGTYAVLSFRLYSLTHESITNMIEKVMWTFKTIITYLEINWILAICPKKIYE